VIHYILTGVVFELINAISFCIKRAARLKVVNDAPFGSMNLSDQRPLRVDGPAPSAVVTGT